MLQLCWDLSVSTRGSRRPERPSANSHLYQALLPVQCKSQHGNSLYLIFFISVINLFDYWLNFRNIVCFFNQKQKHCPKPVGDDSPRTFFLSAATPFKVFFYGRPSFIYGCKIKSTCDLCPAVQKLLLSNGIFHDLAAVMSNNNITICIRRIDPHDVVCCSFFDFLQNIIGNWHYILLCCISRQAEWASARRFVRCVTLSFLRYWSTFSIR